MAAADMASNDDHKDTQDELRNLLRRMLVEDLKAQETRAIEASRTDPTALERYRELQARRRALESATAVGIIHS
jgi:DNA primase